VQWFPRWHKAISETANSSGNEKTSISPYPIVMWGEKFPKPDFSGKLLIQSKVDSFIGGAKTISAVTS